MTNLCFTAEISRQRKIPNRRAQSPHSQATHLHHLAFLGPGNDPYRTIAQLGLAGRN